MATEARKKETPSAKQIAKRRGSIENRNRVFKVRSPRRHLVKQRREDPGHESVEQPQPGKTLAGLFEARLR